MDKRLLALRLTGIGFFIGISIVGGVLLGLWLDAKFASSWMVLLGLFLGVFVAGYGVYKMLLPILSDKDVKPKK